MVRGLWVRHNKQALRMVWQVSKDGNCSYLVGTAHWFPYSFYASLSAMFKRTQVVIFEGPLDDASMLRVTQHGMQADGAKSIGGLVNEDAIQEINRQLGERLFNQTSNDLYLLHQAAPVDYYASITKDNRPWMAFFSIWSNYLGWKYSVDMEAYRLAVKMKKDIRFLETIEEQLDVLDGIPLERIVDHLNDAQNWKVYQDRYVDAYLAGDLEKILGLSSRFPTRTPVVLSQRDLTLFKRAYEVIEQEPAAVFVGLSHIPGVSAFFSDAGYRVQQGL